MANLLLKVNNQSLIVKSDIEKIVENSINYLSISHELTPDWDDLSIKYLFEYEGETIEWYANFVPSQVIKVPGFKVSIVGFAIENDNIIQKITTEPVRVNVYPSGKTDGILITEEELKADWLEMIENTVSLANTTANESKNLAQTAQTNSQTAINTANESKNLAQIAINTVNERAEEMTKEIIEIQDNVANAIKQTVSGNPILIDDAAPFNHKLDIKTAANETICVRGKNLIPFDNKAYNNGKYVAGQTYTMNGISLTINDDGSVYAKGTATNAVIFPLFTAPIFATGIHTVTLSGSPEGASATTYCLRLEKENMVGAYGAEDYGNGKIIENVDLSGLNVNIIIFGRATVDATFYPMLEFGDTVSDFISPCDSCSETADENGVVSGLVSVAKEMSIFSETGAEIECTYNRDTNAVMGDIPTIDQVYSATSENAQSGVALGRVFNNVANAIKGVASGNPITIKGVSVIEHGITVENKGSLDYSTATLTACGKNLIPVPYATATNDFFTVLDDGGILINGTTTTVATFNLANINTVKLPKGRYTLSLKNGDMKKVFIVSGGGDGEVPFAYAVERTFEITEAGSVGYLVLQIPANTTINSLVVYPQLEVGDIATEYEKYKGVTYTFNDDGICEIVSISPNMTIFTNADTTLECEYNRDTNKVIEDMPLKTEYRFNIAELSNIPIPNFETPILKVNTAEDPADSRANVLLNFNIYTALQNRTTDEITKLIDIPAQYDNYIEMFRNSFNNFLDYSEPNIYNNAFGNQSLKLSALGRLLVESGYCLDYKVTVHSNSFTSAYYKAIGLSCSLRLWFASSEIKKSVMEELITPIWSTNTHFGVIYTKPAPIIDCEYMGG